MLMYCACGLVGVFAPFCFRCPGCDFIRVTKPRPTNPAVAAHALIAAIHADPLRRDYPQELVERDLERAGIDPDQLRTGWRQRLASDADEL